MTFTEIKKWRKMTLDQLKKIVELYPNDVIGHYSLGFKYIELNQLELAKHHLETANKLDTKHIATYLALGNVYSDMGSFELAKETYEKGLATIPLVEAGQGQDLQPDLETALEELESF